MRLREKLQSASREIPSVSAEQAVKDLESGGVLFVDVRETIELTKEGTIPGALHAPRGMLEFHIDPQSPTYKQELDANAGKSIVVFCASGMRSLLAAQTMREMGLENVRNLEGGFTAWRNAGGPVGEAIRNRS